jgi:hypothetical protein
MEAEEDLGKLHTGCPTRHPEVGLLVTFIRAYWMYRLPVAQLERVCCALQSGGENKPRPTSRETRDSVCDDCIGACHHHSPGGQEVQILIRYLSVVGMRRSFS